jgi:O-antigen/teichoic acid export membrane protein
LGATSYGYLAVAAHSLRGTEFARLGVVWSILFTLGPGIFLPLEQEIARRVAVASGPAEVRDVRRRVAVLGLLVSAALGAAALALMPYLRDRLLDGDGPLYLATIFATALLAPVHICRGMFAGTRRFGRYGLQLGIDGTTRFVGAVMIATFGHPRPAAMGWLLVGSQLLALAATWTPTRSAEPTHASTTAPPIAVLAKGIGWLLCGALGAQILANAGPIAVKALAAPGDAAAGRFLTMLLLARVPLFLFAALQASLLPGLARLIGEVDRRAVRAPLQRLLIVITSLGTLLTVTMLLVGPTLTQTLFGAGYRSSRLPLLLLCIGSTVYVIGASVAQTLLALHHSAEVGLGWWIGVGVFGLILLVPGDLSLRVSAALLLAAFASACFFGVRLKGALATAPTSSGQLSATEVGLDR